MNTKFTPRRVLGKLTRSLAPAIPLWAYERILSFNPVGFFYHVVSDEDLSHIKHLYPYKSLAEFEQDLRYLKGRYTLVSYQDLLAHYEGTETLPPNAAFISFDDGFKECYTVMLPLLRKYQVPGIFFFTTDFIDNQHLYYRAKISLCIERVHGLPADEQKASLEKINAQLNLQLSSAQNFASWLKGHQQTDERLIDQVCESLSIQPAEFLSHQQPFMTRYQIKTLHEAGFTIGAHTRRHPKLNQISRDEQAAEIVDSCRIICEITDDTQVPFAFPFSGNGVNRDFLARLRSDNPHIGLIFDSQKLRRDLPFIFHRIWVDKPISGISPLQNIPYHLHKAYQRALIEQVR